MSNVLYIISDQSISSLPSTTLGGHGTELLENHHPKQKYHFFSHLMMAESMMSGLLVAPMMKTFFLLPMPSISVKIWLITCEQLGNG